jgi:glycosyltransferase involved in cell wall biosynthesis
MHCSIVIRAYNEERHIVRLLAGICQQTGIPDLEIILVDSGSTDETVAAATAAAGPRPFKVVHIRPEEFTFGRSLNAGIAAAAGELIVIASAHVYPVYPDWLAHLLAPFADPQIGLSYGRQRGQAGANKFSEQQIFAHWYPAQSQARQAHPFCNNANAAIRRSLWAQHPYDETLAGLEDLDWAHWMQGQGHGIAYVAEAEVVHVHNETPRGVYNRYRREAMAFKRIFPHERFHLWDFLRLSLSNIVSDLWHAAQQGVLWPNLKTVCWFRTMQFWGTYQGYRRSGPLTWQLKQTFYYPRGLSAGASHPPRTVKPIDYGQHSDA